LLSLSTHDALTEYFSATALVPRPDVRSSITRRRRSTEHAPYTPSPRTVRRLHRNGITRNKHEERSSEATAVSQLALDAVARGEWKVARAALECVPKSVDAYTLSRLAVFRAAGTPAGTNQRACEELLER
jgi:hypothetical protein